MKITLEHNGQQIPANDSDSLFTQLKAAGINVKSTCGGCASCGQCVVVIKEGQSNLQQINFEEKQLLGNVFHITKERLSCQTFLTGDVTIDISAHLKTAEKKAKVVRRTKEEADQVVEDRKQKAKEKRESRPKRLGGGKKPKAFSFKTDEEKEIENRVDENKNEEAE